MYYIILYCMVPFPVPRHAFFSSMSLFKGGGELRQIHEPSLAVPAELDDVIIIYQVRFFLFYNSLK